MPEAQKQARAAEAVFEGSLLDQIVDEGRIAKEPAAKERGKELIKEFVNQVLDGSMTVSRDVESMINARIAQIDHLLSIQLNEIMHHQAFQKLEASWRGLKYLLDQSETSTSLQIKIFNCNKKELLKDLQRAPEFDQSTLFKKVYEEEFGTFGGAPFGALMATTNSAGVPRISNCSSGFRRPRRRPMRRSLPAPIRASSISTASRRSMRRAIWRRFSTPRNTRSGRASVRAKTRAMSVCACRTC